MVYVARDAGIDKGAGLDVTQISVDFFVRYGNNAAAGVFNVPDGIYNGTSGWLANKPTVAKFVNRDAPNGGDTDAKVVVVKPGKLAKLVGKSLGDFTLDLEGAGDPGTQGVSTMFRVTNGPETKRHCSHFADCSYKAFASGAKLVCRLGTPAVCQ
jgi:hypothetical protein